MASSSPIPWQQISPLLDALLDLPPDQHQAYLDTACADDPALRQHVEQLLALQPQAEQALGDSVTAFVPDLLPDLQDELDTENLADTPDQRIGPYRLLRELGRGGMGSVFLAERDDGHFHKQVALKLIKRGLDTDDILSRFRYERQILASLDHPHIARLYDGGMSDDGRPYFVMEFVEGVPITTYCDTKRLSTKQRLALFRTVCRAVQYAHQNLIIHRDLKPSNILVTEDGTVKLLDFGIAKLLTDEGLEQTMPQTALGVRLMTPEYAAPEQVRGETITTATDVYQLGVLLYELLTGHRPYRIGSRVQAEVERVILEEEPTRPSTMINDTAETAETVSQARSTNADKLQRQLRGDLDNIVLMALQKDIALRYGSVEQLSEDLRRHLTGLPVMAQGDTVLYRLGKFVRRHRVGVVVLGLVVALAITAATFAVTTARQNATITLERDKAEAVADFMVALFDMSDPYESQGDSLSARELLDGGAARLQEELADQPVIRASLMLEIGRVYRNLGLLEEAEAMLDQSLHLVRETQGPDSPEASAALHELSRLHFSQSNYALADSLAQASLALTQGSLANWLARRGTLADIKFAQDNYPAAESLYRESLALYRSNPQLERPDIEAEILDDLGTVLWEQVRYDEAEPFFEEGLALAEASFGRRHLRTADKIHNLGLLLMDQQRYDEAEPLLRESLDISLDQLGTEHPGTYQGMHTLALLLFRTDDLDGAEPLFREVLAFERRYFKEAYAPMASTLNLLGTLLISKGELEEAESLLREAVDLQRATLPEDHSFRSYALMNLSRVLERQGQYADAEPLAREALALHLKVRPESHWAIMQTRQALGKALIGLGRTAEAEPFYRARLVAMQQAHGDEHFRTTQAASELARVQILLGKYAEAEPLLVNAYPLLVPLDHDNPTKQITLRRLVWLYESWGKPDEAARYQAVLDTTAASSD